MYSDFFEQAEKKLKYLCTLWKVTKGWPQQRRILIILWILVSLLPKLLLKLLSGLMNKMAMVAGMEVMHGFNNIDSHSPKPTWLQPLLSTHYGTIPQGDQPDTWWQVEYTGQRKGQHFVFTGIDTLDMNFSFRAYNASAQTTIHGFMECLIHSCGIPYSIASDQGTHFTAE